LILVNLFEGKSLEHLIFFGGSGVPDPMIIDQQTLFSF